MNTIVIALTPSPDGPTLRRRRGELPPARRPRVNAYRLAKFAQRVFNDRHETEWRDLADNDWRDFMVRRFTLSDAERATLDQLDPAIVEHIASAVRALITSGGALEATLPEGKSGGRLVFLGPKAAARTKAAAGSRKPRELRFTIPIMDCSFDANCRNWRCRAG